MSVNVYDLANALERGLRQLPEYQAVKEAKTAIRQDEEAQAILTEFLQLQERFQQAMATGQLPTEDDQSAMSAVSDKIEANPLVKSYFDHQQRLGVYFQDIEGIIFKPLQELLQND